MPVIIYIDGAPGSGKTSIVSKLFTTLVKINKRVRVIWEPDHYTPEENATRNLKKYWKHQEGIAKHMIKQVDEIEAIMVEEPETDFILVESSPLAGLAYMLYYQKLSNTLNKNVKDDEITSRTKCYELFNKCLEKISGFNEERIPCLIVLLSNPSHDEDKEVREENVLIREMKRIHKDHIAPKTSKLPKPKRASFSNEIVDLTAYKIMLAVIYDSAFFDHMQRSEVVTMTTKLGEMLLCY